MNTYKVYWIETHNPDNWEDEEHETGLLNTLDSLPVKEYHICKDGWVDVYCEDIFEADNDEEAYNKVINEYDIPNDIFNIYDIDGNEVATEEGVTNDMICPYCHNRVDSREGHSCWEMRDKNLA